MTPLELMRILGFSQMWPKLQQDQFSTFRFERRDSDWQLGEVVQVVFKPRSKEREVLGIARIVSVEPRCMARYGSNLSYPKVTDEEANADGFPDTPDKGITGLTKLGYFQMWEWLWVIYGSKRLLEEPMNKITLKWVERR